ncbi:hypothetical protein AJ80_03338 [Polytolypa hystricis UAMH7299]|uniref:Uncharacterized protein n=1 Tax=Polytolypa hystricis (strain UAMH7299) TaxID=1447883 RepID=A0A2B7YKC4_POLH7|nr:hypothetical protein AJ80_03338 [Polytolypa hystricis UAMH7299]
MVSMVESSYLTSKSDPEVVASPVTGDLRTAKAPSHAPYVIPEQLQPKFGGALYMWNHEWYVLPRSQSGLVNHGDNLFHNSIGPLEQGYEAVRRTRPWEYGWISRACHS